MRIHAWLCYILLGLLLACQERTDTTVHPVLDTSFFEGSYKVYYRKKDSSTYLLEREIMWKDKVYRSTLGMAPNIHEFDPLGLLVRQGTTFQFVPCYFSYPFFFASFLDMTGHQTIDAGYAWQDSIRTIDLSGNRYGVLVFSPEDRSLVQISKRYMEDAAGIMVARYFDSYRIQSSWKGFQLQKTDSLKVTGPSEDTTRLLLKDAYLNDSTWIEVYKAFKLRNQPHRQTEVYSPVRFSSIVPNGYTLLCQGYADFNGDGFDDPLIIVQPSKWAVLQDGSNTKGWKIMIFKGDLDQRFSLVAENDMDILPEYCAGCVANAAFFCDLSTDDVNFAVDFHGVYGNGWKVESTCHFSYDAKKSTWLLDSSQYSDFRMVYDSVKGSWGEEYKYNMSKSAKDFGTVPLAQFDFEILLKQDANNK